MLEKNNDEMLLKLRSRQLEILEDVMKVCKQNNLDYFIIAGTLIGAIRHNGFIPWDDDIDIAMTRKDYLLFKTIIDNEFNNKYFMQDFDSESHYYKSFAKIRLNNTLYDESEVSHLNIHKGIFIDIFILDEEIDVERKSFHLRAKLITLLRSLISYKHVVKGSESISNRSKIIIAIISPIPSGLLKKFQTYLSSINNGKNNTKYLLNYGCGYGYEKQIHEISDYFPPSTAKFEHLTVSIPNNYDKMLTKIYGDYMTIPKEEDRITHSPSRIEF